MKIIASITFLIFSLRGYCQSDFLKKYSYLTYCISPANDSFIGSGFFIKYGENLFFLTANHLAAATPCNTLNISLGTTGKYIKIDVSGVRKEHLKTHFGEKDILIYKVKQKPRSNINSLEKFIPNYKMFENNQPKEVVFWGFPRIDNEPKFDFNTTFPKPILSAHTIIATYNYVRYNSTLNKTDSIHYYTKPIDENKFSGEGNSGAPVFFKVGKRYFFGGMLTAGVDQLKVAWILRPETILKELTKVRE